MAILVVLCAAKIGGGRRLVAQSVRLGNDRMDRRLNVGVIAKSLGFERQRAKTTLIDKAWTPSYVSKAARPCSMLAIPLQIPEKCRISHGWPHRRLATGKDLNRNDRRCRPQAFRLL
jgi:hypothetical protein